MRELAAEWDRFWGDSGVCYVAGGDGSVNEVASALVGQACAFGVIPAGTGNDFARSLYQGDVGYNEALGLVGATKQAEFSPIDVLKVNDQYSVNVFSLGYDTEVLNEAMHIQRRFRKLGSSAYAAGVLRTLLRKSQFRYDSPTSTPLDNVSTSSSPAQLLLWGMAVCMVEDTSLCQMLCSMIRLQICSTQTKWV